MKKILFLLITVASIACKSNKEKIIGHWHVIEDKKYPNYQTLDFQDSSVLIYDIHNISQYEKVWYFVSDSTIEITELCGAGLTCNFRGDTMWLHKNGPKYLRVDHINKDCINDFFLCSRFELQLDTFKNTIDIPPDSIDIRFVTIGKLKTSYLSSLNSKFKYSTDSFYIQLMDKICINPIEFKEYLEAKKESLDEDDLTNKKLLLTLDKKTPTWLIDSVKTIIQNEDFIDKTYKTCVNKNSGKIELVEF